MIDRAARARDLFFLEPRSPIPGRTLCILACILRSCSTSVLSNAALQRSQSLPSPNPRPTHPQPARIRALLYSLPGPSIISHELLLIPPQVRRPRWTIARVPLLGRPDPHPGPHRRSHEVYQEVRDVHEGDGGGAPGRGAQAPQEDAQEMPLRLRPPLAPAGRRWLTRRRPVPRALLW